jgi:hypothetical protein
VREKVKNAKAMRVAGESGRRASVAAGGGIVVVMPRRLSRLCSGANDSSDRHLRPKTQWEAHTHQRKSQVMGYFTTQVFYSDSLKSNSEDYDLI